MLNDYPFGGYLIFAGIPPFIDGRGELFGGPFIARYTREFRWRTCGIFSNCSTSTDSRDALSPDTPAVALLDRMPDWQRVYGDDVAVVHKRREAPKN